MPLTHVQKLLIKSIIFKSSKRAARQVEKCSDWRSEHYNQLEESSIKRIDSLRRSHSLPVEIAFSRSARDSSQRHGEVSNCDTGADPEEAVASRGSPRSYLHNRELWWSR